MDCKMDEIYIKREADQLVDLQPPSVKNEPEQDYSMQKKKWTRVGVPKFQCLVCGDGAYGNNFGLVTCESCKAFFRRQLNRPRPFLCPTGSKCMVTSGTRKYCPACRLQKCFDVGMRPDIGEVRRRCKREREKLRRERASRRNSSEHTSPHASSSNESCQRPEAVAPEPVVSLPVVPTSHGPPNISSSQKIELRAADSSSTCHQPATYWSVSLSHDAQALEKFNFCVPMSNSSAASTISIANHQYPVADDWLTTPTAPECFNRLLSVCNALMRTLQEPFDEAELSVLFANQSQFASALPQTFTELQGIREAMIKRFIRFAKVLDEFRDRFAFTERVAILKRTLLACYVLHFGLGWEPQRGTRLRLSNGHEATIDQQLVRTLKRKSGLDEHDTNHADYSALHCAIRARFPFSWPVIVAALSIAALFSPQIGLGNSDVLAATVSEDFSAVKQDTASLCERLNSVRRAYLRFIVDYADHECRSQLSGTGMTVEEKRLLVTFCEERIAQACAIGECIAERLSTTIRLDPHSAIKIIPLLSELNTC